MEFISIYDSVITEKLNLILYLLFIYLFI